MSDINPLPAPAAPLLAVGTPVLYVNTEGNERAAIIIGTHDSIKPDDSRIPQPQEGHFHLFVFGYSALMQKLDIPHEVVARDIPDYSVNGQLVGYVKA